MKGSTLLKRMTIFDSCVAFWLEFQPQGFYKTTRIWFLNFRLRFLAAFSCACLSSHCFIAYINLTEIHISVTPNSARRILFTGEGFLRPPRDP